MQIRGLVTSQGWHKSPKGSHSAGLMCCQNYTLWWWLWCHLNNVLVTGPLHSQIEKYLIYCSSLTDFLVLVLCDVHNRSHPLNDHQQELTLLERVNPDFTLWLESAWSPLFCHGNVTVDIPRNFVMSITTAQSLISMQSSEKFHFLRFYSILRQPCDVTSSLIYIYQNLE